LFETFDGCCSYDNLLVDLLHRLNNKGDIAVHSLKDLPTIIDERLTVAAVPAL